MRHPHGVVPLFWKRICSFIGVTLLGLLGGCQGGEYGLVLTVSSTRKVDSYDLRIKDLATNKIVLQRTNEAVDASRDISRQGQEIEVTFECAEPGEFLVYMLGKGSASIRQFYLNDFKVDEVRSENIVLVPVDTASDKDMDNFPACGALGVNCAIMSCKFLDCDDQNAMISPFAKEVCGNGKDDDCSAGCNAPSGSGDEKCVDKGP